MIKFLILAHIVLKDFMLRPIINIFYSASNAIKNKFYSLTSIQQKVALIALPLFLVSGTVYFLKIVHRKICKFQHDKRIVESGVRALLKKNAKGNLKNDFSKAPIDSEEKKDNNKQLIEGSNKNSPQDKKKEISTESKVPENYVRTKITLSKRDRVFNLSNGISSGQINEKKDDDKQLDVEKKEEIKESGKSDVKQEKKGSSKTPDDKIIINDIKNDYAINDSPEVPLTQQKEKIVKNIKTIWSAFSTAIDRTWELYSLQSLSNDEVSDKFHKWCEDNEESLRAIEKLDLSNMGITFLPLEINVLTKLKVLNLTKNQLTSIPEGIANLIELKTLDLSYNQLTQLPAVLGKCKKIKILRVNSNSLEKLPETIGELPPNLKVLKVSNNKIKELPTYIYQINTLTELYTSGNLLGEEQKKQIQTWASKNDKRTYII